MDQSFPFPSAGNNAGSMIISSKGYVKFLQYYAARLTKVHIGNILNYFTHHITNARAEGINSKIAIIEKMAFYYRKKEHLKTAIYFMCGNLELYP